MNRNFLIYTTPFIFALISGCTTVTDYKKPEIIIPTSFKESASTWKVAEPSSQIEQENWWKFFEDKVLDELIETGTNNNFQLKAAVARYNSSIAFLSASNSSLFPQIGLSTSSSNNNQSQARPLRGANQPNIFDSNQVSIVASYELDLWGRARSISDSASALSQAAFQDTQSLKLLIRSEIAANYFSILGLDTQISLLEKSILAYRKQANIVRLRFEEGIASGSDFYRVQTIVENELIRFQSLRTKRSILEHSLALLIGKNASDFSLPSGNVFNVHIPSVPSTLPSQLLERRPDIASNERKVAATNSEIGVAKAAFFPTIGLSAQAGYQNDSTSKLISVPNQFWSIGPAAFLTVFDAGRRDAIVSQAISKNNEAIANYKSSVINAIKEVEDILVDLKNRESSQSNIDNSLIYSDKNYSIAIERYNEGISSYLEIVDAFIQKSQSQLASADQSTQLLIGRVNLIKALGGNWN